MTASASADFGVTVFVHCRVHFQFLLSLTTALCLWRFRVWGGPNKGLWFPKTMLAKIWTQCFSPEKDIKKAP